jgi:hypothetical protein
MIELEEASEDSEDDLPKRPISKARKIHALIEEEDNEVNDLETVQKINVHKVNKGIMAHSRPCLIKSWQNQD